MTGLAKREFDKVKKDLDLIAVLVNRIVFLK